MKYKQPKQTFLTLFLLASLSFSFLAFLTPKVEAQVTTLASTELINFYSMSDAESSPAGSSVQKTIIWALDTDIIVDIVDFGEWCVENYFNTVNVMGTGISDVNIEYLHSLGLEVFKNTFPIPSCFPNYTYSTTYDLATQMLSIVANFAQYDGIVMDDSHNAWRYAHNMSMFEDDYVYYQWLIDNATAILTPIFGADDVNLIMYIGGDECNFTKMPLVNCTGLTFSYYYPPDPLFQYYGAEADIDGDWWLGIFKNTTANAWDIKSYYDSYGLNEYYAYEGWIWNPSANQHPKAETFIKTYNAIVELSESYTVYNLNIGFHWTLYNNTEVTKIIRHLCQNWLDGPTRMDENPLYIYDWDTYYWNETFDTLPYNYSSETYLGWQYISDTANYTYDADASMFRLNFSGSNPSGYKSFSLERMLNTERDLNISLDFTPKSDNLHKHVILREGYVTAQHWVYSFQFRAFTKDLYFHYRIAKAVNPNYDVYIDLGHWTEDSLYHINFQVTLLNASVSISNSTWSWDYTIPDDVMCYNTIKIGYLSIASTIGVTGDVDVTSFKVDNVQCEPLTAWNPPFEFENYIGYYNDLFHSYVFLENGLMVDFGRYNSTFDVLSAYVTDATLLIIDYQKYTLNSVTGDIYGYTTSEATKQLNVTLRANSITHVYIDWMSNPENVDVEITDMEGCGNWVFSQSKYYTFVAKFWDGDGYADLPECSVAFSDGLHWVNMTYSLVTSTYRLDNGTDVVNLGSGTLSIIDSNEIQVAFPIYFQNAILDADNVSLYMHCIDSYGASDGWELMKANYFNIYNLGGHSTLVSVGDAGRIIGGDVFDLYCGNMSSVEATMMIKDLQHVKMLPTFQTFGSNYGLNNITFFIEYCVDDVWVRAFSIVLTPSLAYRPDILGGDCVRWNWTATYYELGTEVKSEKFWCYFQNYNETQSTIDTQLWIDLWFNKVNASTVWGARVNAYYYPMVDNSNFWLRWLSGSNWGVDERLVKQSECFGTLRDSDGNVISTLNLKLVRIGCNMTTGNIWTEEPLPVPFIAKVQHFVVFDLTMGSDPLKGVQTPPWDETKIPTLAQGGLLGSIWTGLAWFAVQIVNGISYAAMTMFNVWVGFCDTVFTTMGFPNVADTYRLWLTESISFLIDALGYSFQLLTMFFSFLTEYFGKIYTILNMAFTTWMSMLTYFTAFLGGTYTSGVNIWVDYNIPQWITLVLILYPIYLVFLWEEEGLGAVIDQLTFLYNVLHGTVYLLLTIAEYIWAGISRLLEAIPVVE